MHDLKHTLLFETLLEEPFNDLVKQAVEDGDVALGYNCYYIPETLLNLPGSFSSRLRAPNCSTTPIGDYYLTNRNCPYTRAILERAVEGSYNYLSALLQGRRLCPGGEHRKVQTAENGLYRRRLHHIQRDPERRGDRRLCVPVRRSHPGRQRLI